MENKATEKISKKSKQAKKESELKSKKRLSYKTDTPAGEKYGVCSFCGKPFEQEFYPEQNRYSNYKFCHKCRKQETDEKLVPVSWVDYNPFPWQVEAEKLLETHRVMVLACGARTGKDRFSNMMTIKYISAFINENRQVHDPTRHPAFRVWSIAPTYDMASNNFEELQGFIPRDWIVNIKKDAMAIELKNGGLLEMKSAHNEESLVGVPLDFCTITEADRIPRLEKVWKNIVMRLLSPGCGRKIDRQGRKGGAGKCILNSSPTGKGYLYQMFQWGNKNYDEYDPDFVSMNLPSYANPYVKEELERIKHTKYGDIPQIEFLRRQMSPDDFARDIEGKFVSDIRNVFGDFENKCVFDLFDLSKGYTQEQRERIKKEWREPISGHNYRIGYDPATGSSGDDPAIVVVDMSTYKVVYVESMFGKNYDKQYDEISYISRRYNYAPCCWLRTGHTAIENQLAKRGVQEIPLNEQGGKKAEYVQSLERAVQNGDVLVIDDGSEANSKLIRQMNDYTEKNNKYSNSAEAHDDFVSALYAAYYDYSVQSVKTSMFSSLIMGF